jgi:hypothetical protein
MIEMWLCLMPEKRRQRYCETLLCLDLNLHLSPKSYLSSITLIEMAVPDYLCLLDPWSEKSENCRDTFFAGMLNLGRDNADYVLSWEGRYQSVSERESKYLVDFLLNHFLLVKGPSLLTGRRIALLSSGDLAIVPGEARKGDQILFSLIQQNMYGFVLRPTMQDAKMPSLLLFSGHGVPEIVQYYTLVGTAWMEEHTGKQLRKARDAETRGRLDGHTSVLI